MPGSAAIEQFHGAFFAVSAGLTSSPGALLFRRWRNSTGSLAAARDTGVAKGVATVVASPAIVSCGGLGSCALAATPLRRHPSAALESVEVLNERFKRCRALRVCFTWHRVLCPWVGEKSSRLGRPEGPRPREQLAIVAASLWFSNRRPRNALSAARGLSLHQRLGGIMKTFSWVKRYWSNVPSIADIEKALRMRDVALEELLSFKGDRLHTLGEDDCELHPCSLSSASPARRRRRRAKGACHKMAACCATRSRRDYNVTLKMRCCYAVGLSKDAGATLGDLAEAVAAFENLGTDARRVMGEAHPLLGR